jgi:hypothetical protein
MQPVDVSVHERHQLNGGRACEDIKLGDRVTLGTEEGTVEEMRSYGRPLEVLSVMMTGELIVRCRDGDSPLRLSRSVPA